MANVVLLLAALTSLLCYPGAHGGVGVRGVHPLKKSFYKSGRDFTCLDGSVTIQFSMVNDDYCDCRDGSDEPGTAACANGVFYCSNRGHEAQNILSSRVNDGICDCCDGTDEYDSGTSCPNVCEEVGRTAKQEELKEMQLRAEGYEKRKEYEQQGTRERQEAEEKVVNLEAELERLKPELETSREAKEVAEEPEKQAKEEHKKWWEEEQEVRKAARLREEARVGFDELDTNSDGFVSIEELQARVELDDDDDGEVSREEALEYLDNEEKVEFEAFVERVWGVVSDKCQFQPPEGTQGEDPNEAEWQAEEEEEEEEEEEDYDDEDDDETPRDSDKMPDYDNATKELIEAANKARDAFRDIESRKRNMENEIRDLKKYLEMSFGERNEFAPLYDKCFEYTDREYTYKMCTFKKVTQKGKHGGRETSLGTWGSWTGPSDHLYAVMKYDNGEKCWNGPNRSATITLKCGTVDELVDAGEPNRCEYALVFTTPLVCEAPPPDHAFPHEEL